MFHAGFAIYGITESHVVLATILFGPPVLVWPRAWEGWGFLCACAERCARACILVCEGGGGAACGWAAHPRLVVVGPFCLAFAQPRTPSTPPYQVLVAVLYSIWKQADFDLFVHGGFYLPVWSREYGFKGTVVAPRMQGSSVNLTGARRGGQQGVADPAAPDAGSAAGAGVGAGNVAR